MLGKLHDLTFGRGGEQYLTICTKEDCRPLFDKLHENDVAVEIKKYHPRRSLDANAYCWVLCDKIAEAVRSTKEDVYKLAVRDAGVFDFLPVKQDKAEKFVLAWGKQGLGWYAEDIGASKLDGYAKMMIYYGSSSYDSREMARLIDHLVDEAKNLDIETMPPDELNALLGAWGNA